MVSLISRSILFENATAYQYAECIVYSKPVLCFSDLRKKARWFKAMLACLYLIAICCLPCSCILLVTKLLCYCFTIIYILRLLALILNYLNIIPWHFPFHMKLWTLYDQAVWIAYSSRRTHTISYFKVEAGMLSQSMLCMACQYLLLWTGGRTIELMFNDKNGEWTIRRIVLSCLHLKPTIQCCSSAPVFDIWPHRVDNGYPHLREMNAWMVSAIVSQTCSASYENFWMWWSAMFLPGDVMIGCSQIYACAKAPVCSNCYPMDTDTGHLSVDLIISSA